VAAPAVVSGNWYVSRTGALGSATGLYQGATLRQTPGAASSGLPNQQFSVGGGLNSSGTFGGGGAMQFSFAVIGGGRDATQITNQNTAIQTYLTAVGA
jgi:hypothetical protein